jgi:hypothetical protein
MTRDESAPLQEPIADAVAAFDAANLAWGQFYRQIWIERAEGDRRRADPVREALGEAALRVAAERGRDEIEQFAAALLTAHDRMLAFLEENLSANEAGAMREIPQALWEARERLVDAFSLQEGA